MRHPSVHTQTCCKYHLSRSPRVGSCSLRALIGVLRVLPSPAEATVDATSEYSRDQRKVPLASSCHHQMAHFDSMRTTLSSFSASRWTLLKTDDLDSQQRDSGINPPTACRLPRSGRSSAWHVMPTPCRHGGHSMTSADCWWLPSRSVLMPYMQATV